MSGSTRSACGLLVAATLFAPADLAAYVPDSGRVVQAVAKRNRDAGRSRALQLEVALRVGEDEPIGRGVLVTHPTGLARLELRGSGGLVERHLLQGSEHTASRGGQPLAEPRNFLPPLFLIQSDSSLGLRAGLSELGADVGSIGLAPCGESDCYVLGDPKRVPPAAPSLPGVDSAPERSFQPVPAAPDGGFESALRTPGFATLWVDIVSFEVKRIDARDGSRVWLGPLTSFGRVSAPAWFRIDEPGRTPVRFEVLGVSPVDAPAAAFSKAWLEGPAPSQDSPGSSPEEQARRAPQIPPGGNP